MLAQLAQLAHHIMLELSSRDITPELSSRELSRTLTDLDPPPKSGANGANGAN